ncbi:HSP20-like chaperone, partial [Calocera cornea HHB12733]
AVELTEEGKEYIVEAELPGVKKEDLEVRVGEGGKSLTIEGKVVKRNWEHKPAAQNGETIAKNGTDESMYSSVFSRTFTLPRPVDGSRVRAKLENGILLLHVPQMEERGSVKVNI